MVNNIKKVIFASNPLRDYGKLLSSWFPDMLEYHLKSTTQLPTYIIAPPNIKIRNLEKNLLIFDYVKFFSFYGIDYNKNAWGELYYRDEYNEEAYNYVKSIFEDSLVVSYEMDVCILRILDYFNIPYIDSYISPVRFLDDQLFSFTSNNEETYKKMLNYKLPEEQIYIQANYLKTYLRQRDFNKIKDEKAVLFIGQTAFDRSLINPETGEIYSILNHKEDFRKAIAGFDKIYYKRHPKASNDKPVLDYLNSLGDVEIIDDNFYSLCARPDIKKVVSISSGGIIEAKYFGKEIQNLLHFSVNLQYGNDFDKEKYINVYEHYFSLHFWADILSPIIETKDYPKEIGFYGIKNKLRNSRGYRDWWGYEDFDHEMLKMDLKMKKPVFLHVAYKAKLYYKRLLRSLYHLTYNKQFIKFKVKTK